MDKCVAIFKENELKNIKLEEKTSKKILHETLQVIDRKIKFDRGMSYIEKLTELEHQLYHSTYIDDFYSILERYDYNTLWDIKEAISRLTNLKRKESNKELIQELLCSKVIDDINMSSKDTFQIYSEKYGQFNCYMASSYLEDEEILRYMMNNTINNNCHNVTYYLLRNFEDLSAITSHVEDHFHRPMYHSYAYDEKEDIVIDLCYNLAMDKHDYDRLNGTQVISKVIDSEVLYELAIVDEKTKIPKTWCKLLRIALYKEYLNSINYFGDMVNGPTSKKSFIKK